MKYIEIIELQTSLLTKRPDPEVRDHKTSFVLINRIRIIINIVILIEISDVRYPIYRNARFTRLIDRVWCNLFSFQRTIVQERNSLERNGKHDSLSSYNFKINGLISFFAALHIQLSNDMQKLRF